MRRSSTRAGTPGRVAAGEAPEPLAVLTFDLSKAAVRQLALGYKDQIQGLARLVAPEGLPKQPLGPVAPHGAADLASGCEADAAAPLAVGRDDQEEERPVEARPALEHAAVLGRRSQALRWAQPPFGPAAHAVLRSDPLTALLPPPLEHEATALGQHPNKKAVRPLPFSRVGLERPLHFLGAFGSKQGPRWALRSPAQRS